MATVLLTRHGETTWNRAGRIQGWAPTRLTDRGCDQARDLAAAVDGSHDPDRLIASDLPRARRTADRVAAVTGLSVETDERWRERDFGRLQGFASDAIYERFPRFSLAHEGRDALTARPESGESLADTRERVLDAWTDLRADLGPSETAVVVSHATPLHAVHAAATSRDFAATLLDAEHDNCAVTEVRVEDARDGDEERVTVVRANDAGGG